MAIITKANVGMRCAGVGGVVVIAGDSLLPAFFCQKNVPGLKAHNTGPNLERAGQHFSSTVHTKVVPIRQSL
jgi:hypothetical protein